VTAQPFPLDTEPTWMTDLNDQREHGIDDQRARQGREPGGGGIYVALCGYRVLPRALVAPCGPRCPHCEHIAHPPAPPGPFRRIAGHLGLI